MISGRCLLAILMVMVLCLSGCKPSAVSSQENNSIERPEKSVTLKLWHIWVTDSDSNKQPFEKALKEWNKANPDIQIVAEATENETYKIKLRTAIAVNEAPDIFYCWGAGFAKPFVEANKVLSLDGYVDAGIKAKLTPGSMDNFIYDGKLYALPTFMIAGVFYCNTEIFNSNGIKIPETFDELLAAIAAFKEKNITPMAIGQKDGWPGIFLQNILAIRIAGLDKCMKALNKEASFNQAEFVGSAQKLTELVKAGAFDSRCMQMTQHEAEQEFINGRAAMYYSGSWAAGSMDRNDSPIKGKVVVRNFPVIDGAGGNAKGFVGGAIDTFMISSSTQHKDEAVKALIKLDENFCKESYLSGAGIPAWKVDVDESKILPIAASIMKLLEDRDGFLLAWDTFLTGSDAQTHIDLVTDLMAYQLSPEAFAVGMQRLNEAP